MEFFKTLSSIFASFILSIACCDHSFAYSCTPLHAWINAEYLYWWSQNSPVRAPLITKNTNLSALGLIGEPGTQIIFGAGSHQNTFDFDGMQGGRLTIGGWIDQLHRYGLEANGFGFPETKKTFSASSVGGKIPVINIPFFDILNSAENALVNRHPNTATARDSFQPWGIDLNGLYNLSEPMRFPLIVLTGIRYINITENFQLNDAIFDLPGFSNSVVNVRDNFSTKNNFYGFQVGIRSDFVYCKLFLDINATITLGENFQKLSIHGQINENNTRIIQPSGLFAEPSNIGSFHHNEFAVVPELRAKLGYHLNQNIHPFIAYNFFYINKVIRPADQIDRNINKSQNPSLGGTGILSGPALPSPHFHNTGMWMQGLSAGVELRL